MREIATAFMVAALTLGAIGLHRSSGPKAELPRILVIAIPGLGFPALGHPGLAGFQRLLDSGVHARLEPVEASFEHPAYGWIQTGDRWSGGLATSAPLLEWVRAHGRAASAIEWPGSVLPPPRLEPPLGVDEVIQADRDRLAQAVAALDRGDSLVLAKLAGLEPFLDATRSPSDQRPMTERYLQALDETVAGLLDTDPRRLSLMVVSTRGWIPKVGLSGESLPALEQGLLLFRRPGGPRGYLSRTVEISSIFGTLLELLDIPLPPDLKVSPITASLAPPLRTGPRWGWK